MAAFALGHQGGTTGAPSHEQVCSGRTGHAETVRVVFDPRSVSCAELLRVSGEAHDPTQGNRQGNDPKNPGGYCGPGGTGIACPPS